MCGKKSGEEGHRSLYLAHAKRALYHLSYIPGLREIDVVRGNSKNVLFSSSERPCFL